MASESTNQAPSLVSLCLDATKAEIVGGTLTSKSSVASVAIRTSICLLIGVIAGEEVPVDVYDLPADLFDELVRCSPPLALQKLQNEMLVYFVLANHFHGNVPSIS